MILSAFLEECTLQCKIKLHSSFCLDTALSVYIFQHTASYDESDRSAGCTHE
ncbi:hypothetical protein XALC_0323 [Xanthomonas albilineans GPE PC73]|uniref:Uncharacterized protein n=1 Tax=Xanthomonas albilineans (strain GPE PC73 / CFBP 7063) TaxID=380358 RepID=D2UB05_XANAP|nr:hypothetical protein XALC_0323 [Xanthomonas albilineans GPE PC73]